MSRRDEANAARHGIELPKPDGATDESALDDASHHLLATEMIRLLKLFYFTTVEHLVIIPGVSTPNRKMDTHSVQL